MNTGVQRSGATPPAARTANTKPVGDEPGNVFGQGKNAPLIAMAHEIPYVATATVAELRDLEYKVERAMEFRGARYLHVFVPCPLGWGSASHDTIRIARLVKETGLFPVFEAEHGEVVGVSKIRRQVPVEEYLRLQRRYAHLFGDPPRTDVIERDPGARRPQHPALRAAPADDGTAARPAGELGDPDLLADTTTRAVSDGSHREEPPFAITLDVGSSLANKTGQLAHRARRVRRPPAALQPRLPGRREHPAVALRGRGGRRGLRARLAEDHGGQPVPGDHGAGLLPPVRDRLQPRPARRGGRASTRSSASSATRRSSGAGRSRPPAEPTGKRVLVVGAGPSGLSAAYHLTPPRPRGDDPRRRPDGRRHDALRHPQVPAAARRARRRGRSASSTWASSSS